MCRYPTSSAASTAAVVSSGGVWNTPKPMAGISTPLLSVIDGTVVIKRLLSPGNRLALQWDWPGRSAIEPYDARDRVHAATPAA